MKKFLVQNFGISTAMQQVLPSSVTNTENKGNMNRITCFDLAVDKDTTVIINGSEIKVFADYGLSISEMTINSLIIKDSGVDFKFVGSVGDR